MNRTDAPKKQPVPFGVNGPREDLLPTTPAGDNTASYDAGFPPVTMILKSAGGLPPKGQDMNQILFELSSICRWFTAGALNEFDATFASSIGGYPKASVLVGDDGATIYISTIDANSNNPNSVTTGWLNLSKITAIAALSGGANKLPYFSGANTAAQTDFTDVGRSVVAQTSIENLLTYLGVTTALAAKQPLDATLTALAGLATGANKLPYFTGNDTAAQTNLTSVGRDIIGKGTIADVLTYLGLGNLPTFGTAAGKNVGTGADELPTTSQADTRYGLKHWASAGRTLVANQTLIINHGLKIDPDLARLDIKLRCVTANNGYEVGDYAIGFAPRFAAGDTNNMTGNLGAMLTATQAQFNCGQSGLILMPKLNGTPVGINSSAAFAQWSFEFHITYQ